MVKLLECFIFKLLKPIDRNNCSNVSIASGCPATVPFMPSFAIIIEPRILFDIQKDFISSLIRTSSMTCEKL